jgi:hypothetical protein
MNLLQNNLFVSSGFISGEGIDASGVSGAGSSPRKNLNTRLSFPDGADWTLFVERIVNASIGRSFAQGIA